MPTHPYQRNEWRDNYSYAPRGNLWKVLSWSYYHGSDTPILTLQLMTPDGPFCNIDGLQHANRAAAA